MSSKKVWPFLLGAAVGAAISYLLTSGKAKGLADDLKDAAGKAKDEWDEFMKGSQKDKTADNAGN